MEESLSPELEQFVQQQIEDRVYQSREQLVADAVRLLRQSQRHLRELRDEVRARIGRLDQGEAIELDDESLAALLDRIEAEVRVELATDDRQGE